MDLSTEAYGGIIIDFKTKDTTDITKFKTYEGHKQQLIAYAYGLQMERAKCGNILLSALAPNILTLEMHDDLETYWYKFKLLVKYWHFHNYNRLIGEV